MAITVRDRRTYGRTPLTRRAMLVAALVSLPFVVMVVAVGVQAQDAQQAPGRPSACDVAQVEARDWAEKFVEAHGRLPEYPEIVELPRSVARWVVLALPPREQHAFWYSQMQDLLETSLDQAERDALTHASALLTVEIFERWQREGASSVREDLSEIHRVLASAFDDASIAQVFSLARRGGKDPGPLPEATYCSCNTASADDCEGGELWTCKKDYQDCTFTTSGCGFMWNDPCDGGCCRATPQGGGC